MAENMLSNRPDYGRTFNTSMWAIGLIAAVQLFAVVVAVLSRTPRSGAVALREFPEAAIPIQGGDPAIAAPRGENQPTLSDQVGAAESAALNDQNRSVGMPSEQNVLVSPPFRGPTESASPSLSRSLLDASFDAAAIDDPILERLVSAGEELRGAGNMPGALQALMEAEAALPNHPRVLSELAATHRQMGLEEKAAGYWERVLSLGEERAGSYYGVASRQLRGEEAPAPGSTGQLMRIGEILVDEQSPGSGGGQTVSLRVVIDGDPAIRPTATDVSLLVYFYDFVDGNRIDASTADTSYDYPTSPYDWSEDGTEEIIVNYQQPVFTEEQSRELGSRVYYGYVIEIYYQNRLQQKITMPEDIGPVRMSETAPTPEVPDRLGPENALFPE